ncbi:MAG: hypothetical protein GY729_05225, partial [Desulfobacteraceae bacterium]|nr:hypothetical protein [Desulfobacteraceae bacterium]
IIGLFLFAFWVTFKFELFESLNALTGNYDRFSLDEFLVIIIVFLVSLIGYNIYYNRKLFCAVQEKEESEAQVSKLNQDLEKRIEQKTSDLVNLNLIIQAEMDAREKIESQLLQKQKLEAIGTMAGGIAHDFNTLLGIIMGYTGIIKSKVSKEDIINKHCIEIMDAANRSKDLVKQISDFNSPDQIDKSVTHFHDIVQDAARLLRASLPDTISLFQDVPLTHSPVYANSNQMVQVLLNLGVNAGHAIEDTGKILIKIRSIHLADSEAKVNGVAAGDFFIMTIQDSGCGIKPEILNNIFDPFFTT